MLTIRRQSQKTALAWAASHGNAVAVRELLKAKASVGLRDNCGWTAVAWAVTGLDVWKNECNEAHNNWPKVWNGPCAP